MTIAGWGRGRLRSIGVRIGHVVVALMVLCTAGTPVPAQEKLDLGMISDGPSKTIKLFTPLFEYLKAQGLPMGKITSAESVDGMVDLIKQGKVDFVFESPYGAAQLMEATGAYPILIREKDGIREYNSVVFVNKDSDIENFADLAGEVVVFQDPGSTSAYILPRNLLAEAGLELVESERPVPGKLAYYFSGDDENLLAHVKLGKADAGGVDRTAVTQLPDFRIVPPESSYVPRHVVLVRDGLDSGALKDALLKMAADPEASEVLEAIETPTGFSEFEGDPSKIMNDLKAALGL